MDEIIRCTVLGVASVALGDVQTNPTGREIWTGIRVRTSAGKTRFLQSALVEAEASLIIGEAIRSGRELELWLSGKEARAYVYGIKSDADDWYDDTYTRYLSNQAIKLLVLAILMLPLLGAGLLVMPASFMYFAASSAFAPRHGRRVFDLGYEEGVLGRRPDRAQAAPIQALAA